MTVSVDMKKAFQELNSVASVIGQRQGWIGNSNLTLTDVNNVFEELKLKEEASSLSIPSALVAVEQILYALNVFLQRSEFQINATESLEDYFFRVENSLSANQDLKNTFDAYTHALTGWVDPLSLTTSEYQRLAKLGIDITPETLNSLKITYTRAAILELLYSGAFQVLEAAKGLDNTPASIQQMTYSANILMDFMNGSDSFSNSNLDIYLVIMLYAIFKLQGISADSVGVQQNAINIVNNGKKEVLGYSSLTSKISSLLQLTLTNQASLSAKTGSVITPPSDINLNPTKEIVDNIRKKIHIFNLDASINNDNLTGKYAYSNQLKIATKIDGKEVTSVGGASIQYMNGGRLVRNINFSKLSAATDGPVLSEAFATSTIADPYILFTLQEKAGAMIALSNNWKNNGIDNISAYFSQLNSNAKTRDELLKKTNVMVGNLLGTGDPAAMTGRSTSFLISSDSVNDGLGKQATEISPELFSLLKSRYPEIFFSKYEKVPVMKITQKSNASEFGGFSNNEIKAAMKLRGPESGYFSNNVVNWDLSKVISKTDDGKILFDFGLPPKGIMPPHEHLKEVNSIQDLIDAMDSGYMNAGYTDWYSTKIGKYFAFYNSDGSISSSAPSKEEAKQLIINYYSAVINNKNAPDIPIERYFWNNELEHPSGIFASSLMVGINGMTNQTVLHVDIQNNEVNDASQYGYVSIEILQQLASELEQQIQATVANVAFSKVVDASMGSVTTYSKLQNNLTESVTNEMNGQQQKSNQHVSSSQDALNQMTSILNTLLQTRNTLKIN